jgi:hypothetical protein
VTRRPILVLSAMAVVLAALAVAATLRRIIPELDLAHFNYEGEIDQVAIDDYYRWIQSGYVYSEQTPWLLTSAVIAGVAALALAAYRAQSRIQAAGTRTVSAPASISARNPMTTPKSSPSSSNSSARSSRTSNVDAFR